MKRLILISALLFTLSSFSQKASIALDIKVIDDQTDSLPIDNARIRIIKESKVVYEAFSDSAGVVKKILVPCEGIYTIKVDKEGYALKFGLLNADFVDPGFLSGHIKFPMIVAMVKPTETEDFAFLQKEPMIKFYLDSTGAQTWDEAHLNMMLQRVEKCKMGWNSDQAENFAKSNFEAESEAKHGNYKVALNHYKSAQKIEDSPEVQIAIKDCEIKLAIEENNEIIYQKYIELGDQLLENKRHDEANAYYKKALDLRPLEVYPREKIAQCEAIVSSQN